MQKKPIQLEELEKREILVAPEGYFDTLPLTIQQRISQRPVAINGLSTGRVRYALRISMLALVVLTSYWFYQQSTTTPSPQAVIAEMPATDIVEYLKQSSVSQEDLVDMATKENIEVQNLLLRETEEQKLLEEIDPALMEESM